MSDPPVNIEAEEQVLGSLMVYDPAANLVFETGLEPDDFYLDAHRAIFGVAQKSFGQGQAIDELSMLEHAQAAGIFEVPGVREKLRDLPTRVNAPGNVAGYAKIVREKARRRRLSQAGLEISKMAADPSADLDAAVHDAVLALLPAERSRVTRLGEVLDVVMQEISEGGTESISTGYAALDRMVHGLLPANLILVAARPSMGKSVLAAEIALRVARQKEPVLFFSLEMSEKELTTRMISSSSGVSMQALKKGKLTPRLWKRALKECQTLDVLPLWIDSTPAATLTHIESRARALKSSGGLSLIVVDYLQMMAHDKDLSDFERVSRISTGLKDIARRLNVPVLAVSQLSRASETRPDKKPRLSDLRQSGQLEQDADLAILIHRENPEEALDDKINLIIAKQRNGPTGTVELTFNGATTSITE